MSTGPGGLGPGAVRSLTMRALRIDRDTATVVAAMRAADIPCLLLKGPSTAAWLYPEEFRFSSDIDLLVPIDHHDAATEVLRSTGYRRRTPPEKAPPPALAWDGPDGGPAVDLHHTVLGASAPPQQVWQEFRDRPELLELAGGPVPVPRLGIRALHMALHAIQNGPDRPKPMEDLARALRRADLDLWREAAGAAARIGAVDHLAGGLRMHPDGVTVADRLGLPRRVSRAASARMRSTPRGTRAFARLDEIAGAQAKLRYLWQRLTASPRTMERHYPLARHGPLGLGAAYVLHPFVLLACLPAAVRAYWRAGR